jgi:hypothetical protein
MATRWGPAARAVVIGVSFWGTLLIAGGGAVAAAQPADRLEGYYYPKINSHETYVSRAKTLEDSTRTRRLGFVTGLTEQLADMPYAPSYAIFAKGNEGNRLIIVAYNDGELNTVYRARALLASLTALARLTPLFQQLQVEELFTFFDLCKLLGFTTITISDGRHFTHQVVLK